MDRTEIESIIFELSGQGKSYQEISDVLTERKIPTLSGKGVWGKGTVYKVLKKQKSLSNPDMAVAQEPANMPEPDPDKTLRAAYQAVLAELDRTKNELNRKSLELDTAKAENQRLVNQLNNVKQKEGTGMEMNQVLSELSQVKAELAQLRALFSPVKDDRRTDGKTVEGWNVVCSGGYYRAFRRIKGKMQSVYIGKTFDIQKARQKVIDKEKELMTDDVDLSYKVKQTIPEDDDRADRGGDR